MKIAFALLPLVAALPLTAAGEKPRIFLTESHPLQLSAEGSAQNGKGVLSVSGGTSPQLTEVMKAFMRDCPGVAVTAAREKADYVVRFDHEEPNPFMFVSHGNKVAVFDRNDDLIHTVSTRKLSNAVRETCTAITSRPGK